VCPFLSALIKERERRRQLGESTDIEESEDNWESDEDVDMSYM
jgi:hypothetical protein